MFRKETGRERSIRIRRRLRRLYIPNVDRKSKHPDARERGDGFDDVRLERARAKRQRRRVRRMTTGV